MAAIGPGIRVAVDVHDPLDVYQDCLAVLVLGVEEQQFHAVHYLSVGRAIKDGHDLTHPLIQVLESFLNDHRATPGCLAIYSPWYSRPIIRLISLAPATPNRLPISISIDSPQPTQL